MADYQYNSINIHYEYYRPQSQNLSIKTPLVFLHGWGTEGNTFLPIIDHLSTNYHIYTLDFPGFGSSDEPDFAWSLDQYTDMILAFLGDMKIQSPVLIGHSFGGRVAIKLSDRVSLSKLILINSAGIKPKRHLSYYIKVYGFKLIRQMQKWPVFSYLLKEPVYAYSEKYSSADYKAASQRMKAILSKVVNDDLTKLLPAIDVPTLLIWGDSDTATPLRDAELMTELIPDSGLVVYENCGHFSYLEQAERTVKIVSSFIGGHDDF